MLDVDIAALHHWGALLRSSSVPASGLPAPVTGGATGAALTTWTAAVRTALDRLNADVDRFGAAVAACARSYEDVA